MLGKFLLRTKREKQAVGRKRRRCAADSFGTLSYCGSPLRGIGESGAWPRQCVTGAPAPSLTLRMMSASGTAAAATSINVQNTSI